MTELLNLPVFDLKGRRLGAIKDAALVPLVDPVRIDRFLLGGGYAWLTIRHDQIRSISLDGIHLKDELLTPYHADEYMLRVGRDLLDQQIIDGQGRKVVRINDVTFELHRQSEGDVLWVLEVDIGVRSIFRRIAQGIIPRRWIRRVQGSIAPHSIRWEFCNILEPDPQRRLRLNISNRMLEEMHPADLAEIVADLSPEDREAIFETIDSEVAAEALSEVDPEIQASILESIEAEKAADIVEEMSPDDAAAVLSELEERTSQEILEEMEAEPKEEIEELLEHDRNTAGGLMNTEYVAVLENATVADAIESLKQQDELIESLHVLFLVDDSGRLKAAIPLARLFLAASSTPLKSLASETLVQARTGERQDRVTEKFDKYNLVALPVVNEFGTLVGVITADDVIGMLREEK